MSEIQTCATILLTNSELWGREMRNIDEIKRQIDRGLERKDWNRSDLARECGHQDSWISMIMSGKRGFFNMQTLLKIAELLNLSIQLVPKKEAPEESKKELNLEELNERVEKLERFLEKRAKKKLKKIKEG